MEQRIVVIAGASGLVGSAAIARFAASGWKVIGLSRRAPAKMIPGVDYRCVDLLDPEGSRDALRGLRQVTHLVYAALFELPGLVDT